MIEVRYDVGRMDAAVINDKGYLKADAYATRVGVFTYILKDGTIRRELRSPEEVFAKDSMDSLREVVITNNHPPEPLNAQNTKLYAAGWTGKDVKKKEKFIQIDTTITESETITQIIEGGKHELSCGYTCEIENMSGEFDGERYDAIQRKIRYNHLSVVDRGRAGAEVKIKFDSAEAETNFAVMRMDAGDALEIELEKKDVQNKLNAVSSKNQTNCKEKVMTKITIDGVDYECSESLAPVLVAKFKEQTQLKADADKALAAKDALQGKVDGLESDAKVKNDKIAELEKRTMTDKEVMDRADALRKVHSFAKKVIGEDFKADGLSLADIKKAAVTKAKPDLNLDGKTEDYIGGLFDAICETTQDSAGDALKTALGNHTQDIKTKRYDQNDAHKASMENDMKHFQEYKGL